VSNGVTCSCVCFQLSYTM